MAKRNSLKRRISRLYLIAQILKQNESKTTLVKMFSKIWNEKCDNFVQVFSDMDFLGWYSTGDSPGVQEIAVHQQISDINESPLFLQVSMLYYLTSVKISRYVCDCL